MTSPLSPPLPQGVSMTIHQSPAKTNGPASPVPPPPPPLTPAPLKAAPADTPFAPHNAHKHPHAPIDPLAASIAEIGLINEPLVCRDPETGRYPLIAGEGRTRAMLLLGRTTT